MHKKFVGLVGLVVGTVCVLSLAANWAVDPLWFYHGNLLTEKNFAFNERQAKLNQLLREPAQYDCLIFGSSRATLLPASAFSPYRCFNLSFSGGRIEEFIAFAEYLRHAGMRPALIIVGVDGFNFLAVGRGALSIPEYVTAKQSPPGFLKTYLAFDSLIMSWRTLMDKSPLPRYYDRRFDAYFRANAPRFQPKKTLEGEGLRRPDEGDRHKYIYQSDNAALYHKLISVFPAARAIAYVPPQSAWHIAAMAQNGVLQGYLDALHSTAPYFSVFIDFSIPSPVTWRTDNTYDGSHYLPSINRVIARTLLAPERADWGVDLKQVGDDSYSRLYRTALHEFKALMN